jgi:hypothetical protein
MEERQTESPTLIVFRECMAEFAGAYGRAFDKPGTNAYWRALRSLGPDRMRGAFEKAIREERFCPSPAAVRAHAKATPQREAAPKQKSYTPPTEAQWAEIRRDVEELRRRIAARG